MCRRPKSETPFKRCWLDGCLYIAALSGKCKRRYTQGKINELKSDLTEKRHALLLRVISVISLECVLNVIQYSISLMEQNTGNAAYGVVNIASNVALIRRNILVARPMKELLRVLNSQDY